ncbi:MAG: 30S ribosome-binding factor RbfA [Dehalococcoidia bacterium]|nr:30S ribosome-binding factor RbfA [Dehalococcoidia bacterium]
MPPNRRLLRVNETLRQELSELISRQLQDPRLSMLISVTAVRVSHDLRYARVFVSVLGTAEEHKTALQGLRSATPFMRHQLAERLKLRTAPQLQFQLDDSIERGVRVLSMINTVVPTEPAPAEPQQTE